MADNKISADAALAESAIDNVNDLIPIVDVSEALDSDKNKRVAPKFFRRAVLEFAGSDETTALATGLVFTGRARHAMKIDEIRISLSTAQASGSIFTVDVKKNGTSLFSTLLTIDNTEKTSTTAATAAVLSTTTFADDDEYTAHITQIGDGSAKGLKVAILGSRTA